jgi:hypothetical protein
MFSGPRTISMGDGVVGQGGVTLNFSHVEWEYEIHHLVDVGRKNRVIGVGGRIGKGWQAGGIGRGVSPRAVVPDGGVEPLDVEIRGGVGEAGAECGVVGAGELVAQAETIVDLEALVVVGIGDVGLEGIGPVGGTSRPDGVSGFLIQLPKQAGHEATGPSREIL